MCRRYVDVASQPKADESVSPGAQPSVCVRPPGASLATSDRGRAQTNSKPAVTAKPQLSRSREPWTVGTRNGRRLWHTVWRLGVETVGGRRATKMNGIADYE